MQGFGKIVKVRSPSWPRGGAADPHSCVPLVRLTVQKVAEPLQAKKEEVGGEALFERFSLKWDAPCAGCGGSRQAGSASAGGFSDDWSRAHNFSPVLLSLPPLPDFPVGFSSCDKTSWTFKKIFFFFFTSSSANMYSAALLLMLAVRIYADSMEGPTGKRRKTEMFACLGLASAHL